MEEQLGQKLTEIVRKEESSFRKREEELAKLQSELDEKLKVSEMKRS